MLFLEVNDFCANSNVLAIILFIKKLVEIVLFVIPIALIIVLSVDMTKNVIASNEDNMKKNLNLFIKRIFFCVSLFFVVPIVSFIMSLFGNSSIFDSMAFFECYNNATQEEIEFYRDIENEKNKQSEEEYQKEIDSFIDAVKKENYSSNTSNANKNNIKYSGTIYVGDSRTVGMCRYLNINIDNSFKSGSDELCIAENGKKLSWLKNTAEGKILKILRKNQNKNYNIVINLGVNNMYNNKNPYKDYVKEYNSFVKKIGDSRLIVTSVTQTNFKNNGKVSISNDTVKNFNSKLKSGISSSINYCDLYGYLESNKYSWNSKKDGLHYDKETYKKIYKKINSCISSASTPVAYSASGSEKILKAADKFVKKIKSDGDWVYGSTSGGLNNVLKKHKVTCNKFVSYVLYSAGYISKENCIVGHANNNTDLKPSGSKCLSNDVEIITKKELGRSIKMSDLKNGDVVVRNGKSTHDIAVFAYKKGESYYYYSANSKETVLGYRKSTNPQARSWFKKHGITAIIRAKR